MTKRLEPFEPSNATMFQDFIDYICPGCSWDEPEETLDQDVLDDPHAEWPGCPVIALVQTSDCHTGHWYFTDKPCGGSIQPFSCEPYCKARRTNGEVR